MADRREDPYRAVQAGGDVADRDADLLVIAVGLAGETHQPADALDGEVVAGAIARGAAQAEAGDRCVDDVRVERAAGVFSEAEALHRAGADVLDAYVCFPHQTLGRFAVVRAG